MQFNGKVFGLISGVAAMLLGLFFAASAVFDGMQALTISGQQAGVYFGAVGAIVGLSSAVMGVLFTLFKRKSHGL